MSDRDEVLKKADALLGRYGLAAREKPEGEFPILTEIVDERPADTAAVPATGAPVDASQRELEARIVRQVQQAVNEQLGDILGEPLRERLQAVLRDAVESAAQQIRNEVESRVQAAVEQAIKRLRDELL